jgi:hypothetical protein
LPSPWLIRSTSQKATKPLFRARRRAVSPETACTSSGKMAKMAAFPGVAAPKPAETLGFASRTRAKCKNLCPPSSTRHDGGAPARLRGLPRSAGRGDKKRLFPAPCRQAGPLSDESADPRRWAVTFTKTWCQNPVSWRDHNVSRNITRSSMSVCDDPVGKHQGCGAVGRPPMRDAFCGSLGSSPNSRMPYSRRIFW